MKSKIGYIFLTLGIIVFVVLGILIYVDGRAISADVACRLEFQNKLANNTRILSVFDKYLVSYDRADQELIFNTWTLGSSPPLVSVTSKIPLVCEVPSYHCFSKKENIEAIHFKPPYGVIKLQQKNVTKLFPFYWNSQKDFKLNHPVSMCGQSFAEDDIIFHNLYENLVSYHQKSGTIFIHSLRSFMGASPSSMAVFPDQVFKVTQNGELEKTNCDEVDMSENRLDPPKVFFQTSGVTLFKKNKVIRSYRYVGDFYELNTKGLIFDDIVFSDSSTELFGITNHQVFQLINNEKSVTQELVDDLAQSSDEGIIKAMYSKTFKKFLSMKPESIFTKPRLILESSTNRIETPKNYQFKLGKSGSSFVGFISANQIFEFFNEGESSTFQLYQCQE